MCRHADATCCPAAVSPLLLLPTGTKDPLEARLVLHGEGCQLQAVLWRG